MGHPPFTTWSDTDHSGAVIICTVLALVYWVVPGVGQQALVFRQHGIYSWTQHLYATSMVVGLAQSIVVLVACSYGFGKSIQVLEDAGAVEALRLYHVSNVLYVLALGAAKGAGACSVVSLTVPDRSSIGRAPRMYRRWFYLVAALSALWTVGSIIALSVQCESASAADLSSNTCTGTFRTWVGIFVSDGLTDLAITAFAAVIIMPTQNRITLKLIWFIPFFIRLSVIALAGLRLAVYHSDDVSEDPTLAPWLFSVFTQIQIFLSLLAAGFPALRKTVLDLVTNFGVSEDSQNRSWKGPGYILSSLKKKKGSQEHSASSFSLYTGPGAKGSTTVNASTKGLTTGDDDSQRGIMRQDEYEITVTGHGTRDA